MNIVYNDKTDLTATPKKSCDFLGCPDFYIRLDDKKQALINRRVSEDIVFDIENDRIVDIEILDVSKHVSLDRLLPVKYEAVKA